MDSIPSANNFSAAVVNSNVTSETQKTEKPKAILKPSKLAKTIIKGGVYQHYKGKKYLVHNVARNTETLVEHVVYQTLYGAYDFWIRPLDMFLETVTCDGEEVPRFKPISQ